MDDCPHKTRYGTCLNTKHMLSGAYQAVHPEREDCVQFTPIAGAQKEWASSDPREETKRG